MQDIQDNQDLLTPLDDLTTIDFARPLVWSEGVLAAVEDVLVDLLELGEPQAHATFGALHTALHFASKNAHYVLVKRVGVVVKDVNEILAVTVVDGSYVVRDLDDREAERVRLGLRVFLEEVTMRPVHDMQRRILFDLPRKYVRTRRFRES